MAVLVICFDNTMLRQPGWAHNTKQFVFLPRRKEQIYRQLIQKEKQELKTACGRRKI